VEQKSKNISEVKEISSSYILEAKKKERDARCKPQADRLAQLQKEILAAQQ